MEISNVLSMGLYDMHRVYDGESFGMHKSDWFAL